MKRAFDFALSAVGILVLSPIMVLIGLSIWLSNGRPILFRQERIGYRRKPFVILKFRTMVRNAERLGRSLTVGDDQRITRLGHWLRKTKLDELPQLFNVLKGEMSFVGPRPEVERYVAHYTSEQSRVLELVPGITDAASIRFRRESELLAGIENPEQFYIEQILPEKVRLNLEYAARATMLHDFGMIVRTLVALLQNTNISSAEMPWATLNQERIDPSVTPSTCDDTVAGRFPKASPDVSVIVPCRNECRHIESCLTSILAQAEPAGGMEVLVADGMSDDGTREILQRLAGRDQCLRLLDNPRQITPVGLNLAIRAARGQIIIRMDAHTEYAPDYIRCCVEVLQHTGAANVGGPARTKATTYVQRAVAATHRSPFSTGGAAFHRPDFEGEVDTVFYGCWRKQTLLEAGLFDEELVRNQDDELNFRIKQRGGRLWQSPRIRCWYSPRSSLATLFKQYFQYGYWKVRVIQKHRRPTSLRQLAPVLFVSGLLIGWLAGFINPMLWTAYAASVATYLLLNAVFSLRVARDHGWRLLPILPAVFLTYHLSYGLGFAAGIVDFLLLRRHGKPMVVRPVKLWSEDGQPAAAA